MTSAASTARKLLRDPRPWRITRLPTVSSARAPSQFFGNGIQVARINVIKALDTRVCPIEPLRYPPAPYESGPAILRAFLYARKRWPDRPFFQSAPKAIQAVYESYRVDGLPRVVFTVGKSAEEPLRGKLHGVLRHQFRRRGKMAFKLALERLRRENPGFRCDLDLLFILNRDAILIPFVELLDAMRNTLLRVPWSIVKAGRENARLSEPFLVKRDEKPKHVLHSLMQSVGDVSRLFIDVKSLRRETRKEVKERWSQYAMSTVQGRQSKIWLLPDGTFSRYKPEEWKQHRQLLEFGSSERQMNFPSSTAEQGTPMFKPKCNQFYDHLSFDEESDTTPSAVRMISDSYSEPNFGPSANPTYPSNSGLSSELESSSSATSSANVGREEGFEYLFCGKTDMPSVQPPKPENVREAEEPESRKVALEWPPRGLGDDPETFIEGDTSNVDEFRASIDLIEKSATSFLEPPNKTDPRPEPISTNQIISYSKGSTDGNEGGSRINRVKTIK